MDSNHNKQIQNLLCYHYTMRQWDENGAYYSISRFPAQEGKLCNRRNVHHAKFYFADSFRSHLCLRGEISYNVHA